MKHLLTAFALASTVLVAAAADLGGTWKVIGDVMGNAVNFTATMKQDGETLSGTVLMDGQKDPVPVSGTVKDATATFTFTVAHEGSTYTNTFTGTVGDDGVMKGKIDVQGIADGTFTATRQP